MNDFSNGFTMVYNLKGEMFRVVDIVRDENGKVVSVDVMPIAPVINLPISETKGIDWSCFDNNCPVPGCGCKSQMNVVHSLGCKCGHCLGPWSVEDLAP